VTIALMEDTLVRYDSLKALTSASKRICSTEEMAPGLIATYPELSHLLVLEPLSTILDAVDKGACYAAIVPEDKWRAERLFDIGDHCSTKVMLPETLSVVANNIPVRQEIQREVSWAIASEVESGEYMPLVNEALVNYTWGECEAMGTKGDKTSFGVSDLGGPMIVLSAVAVISVLVTRVSNRFERGAVVLKNRIDTNQDGKVSIREMSGFLTKGSCRRFFLGRPSKVRRQNVGSIPVADRIDHSGSCPSGSGGGGAG